MIRRTTPVPFFWLHVVATIAIRSHLARVAVLVGKCIGEGLTGKTLFCIFHRGAVRNAPCTTIADWVTINMEGTSNAHSASRNRRPVVVGHREMELKAIPAVMQRQCVGIHTQISEPVGDMLNRHANVRLVELTAAWRLEPNRSAVRRA